MNEQPIIWHNPRCSKSRQTLALLEELGFRPEQIKYLENPPDQSTINDLLQKLGITAQELLRKGEPIYKQLNLAKADQASCLTALAEHPILIERPIVLYQGKAAIGRPPEQIKKLFR